MASSVSLSNTGNMTVGVLDEITYSPAVMGSVYIGGVNTSSTYLTAPSNSAFAFGTGDFTIEAWVYRIKDNGHDLDQDSNFDQNIFDFRTNDSTAINIAYDGGLYGHTGKIYCIINGAYALVSTTTIDTGAWYHVAVVRSGTAVTLYINGTAEATTTSSRNFATATPCKIGGRYVSLYTNNSSDWRTWQGYLTGVRVVKGNAVYTSNFTPSVYPLTAVTGTSLLLNFFEYNNYLTDSSTNNFTVTSTNSVQYRFSPALPDGNVSSYVGKGYDSAYLKVASNSAFGFGTGDYTVEGWFYKIETNGPSNNGGGGAPQTFFDFRVSGTTLASTSAQNALYIYHTNSTKKISVLVNGSVVATSTATIELNTWYHVAYVRSGTNEYLFINGALDSTITSATTNYVDSPINIGGASAYVSGTGPTYGTFYSYATWRGYISNVRIIKGTAVYTSSFTPPTTALKAISGTSLLTCQTANKNKDNSTNNFTVFEPHINNSLYYSYVSAVDITPFTNFDFTSTGTSVQKQYSNGAVQSAGVFDEVNISPSSYGSLSFTGDGNYNNYLSFPASTNWQMTGDFTIECWAYFNSFVGYNSTINPVLFDQYSGGSTGAGNWQWYFTISGGISSATFVMYYDGSSTFTNTTTLNINTWYHLAVTRSGSTIRMFINGVLQPTTATFSGTVGRNDTLWFGAQHSGISYFFNGYMSNARIVNGTALYTSTFTPSTSTFTYLLTAVTNTTLLLNTKKPNPFSDSSIYNATATIGGNGNVTFSNTTLPTLDGNYTGYSVSKLLSTGNLQIAGSYNELVNNILSSAPSSGLPTVNSSLIVWYEPAVFPDSVYSYQSYAINNLSNNTTLVTNSTIATTSYRSLQLSYTSNVVYNIVPNNLNYFSFTNANDYVYSSSANAAYMPATINQEYNIYYTAIPNAVHPTYSIWAKSDNWQSPVSANAAILTLVMVDGSGYSGAGATGATGYSSLHYSGSDIVWDWFVAQDAGPGNSGMNSRNARTSIPYSSLSPGWHHFVVTMETTKVSLYVDGIFISNSNLTVQSSYTITPIQGNYNLYLGGSPSSTPYSYTTSGFKGSVGQFVTYIRTLSNTEIQTLYNSRAGLYL